MKILVSLAAIVSLSGCVAIPYDAPPTTYYPAYPTYGYAYPAYPAYAAPVYVGPPVNFSFGLNYRSGGGYHRYHDGFRGGHRHLDGYRGGFRGGFRGR